MAIFLHTNGIPKQTVAEVFTWDPERDDSALEAEAAEWYERHGLEELDVFSRYWLDHAPRVSAPCPPKGAPADDKRQAGRTLVITLDYTRHDALDEWNAASTALARAEIALAHTIVMGDRHGQVGARMNYELAFELEQLCQDAYNDAEREAREWAK